MQGIAKVIIIGAGAAGIPAAKYAMEYGLQPMVILEQRQDLGGLWNPKTGFTWDSMTTNISKYSCAYRDFPWPEGTPHFPKAVKLYEYMKSYADHFKVSEKIQYRCTVKQVIKNEEGLFKVTWQKAESKKQQTMLAQNVIVASGMFAEPRVNLGIPGMDKFQGKIIHSAQYKKPEDFAGQTVLTVGGCISGVEISADLVKSVSSIIHQCNKPFFVMGHYMTGEFDINGKKMVKKVPQDFMGYARYYLEEKLPEKYEDQVRLKNERFAKLCRYQRDAPGVGFKDSDLNRVMYKTISTNYVQSVIDKKIMPKMSSIKQFTEKSVIFKDDSEYNIDTVILATGYENNLTYLSTEIKNLIQYAKTDDRQVGVLYNNIVNPNIPNLFLMGQYKGSVVPAFQYQALYICKLIAKQISLPSSEDIEKQMKHHHFVQNLKDKPQSINHNYTVYADKLNKAMGQNLDFEKLKRQKPQLYSRFIKYPTFQNSRAFSLDQVQRNVAEIQAVIESCEDGQLIQ